MSDNRIGSSQVSFSFEQLRQDAMGFRTEGNQRADLAIRSNDATMIAAALVALDGWALSVHLIPQGLEALIAEKGLTIAERSPEKSDGHSADPPSTTSWFVYTSGTTGTPKAIEHSLASLSRTVVKSERAADLVWGLVYDPNRMAGLQVLLQALATEADLFAPSPDSSIQEKVNEMAHHGVTALSATPTIWRKILQSKASADLPLKQVTLGGEIADQQVLNGLKQKFPSSRIVHVFASTETGAAFSVTDGLAGFPLVYLSEPPRGIRLKIEDEILHVYSPKVALADEQGFVSTGDVVEIVGNRVIFKGRATGVVNVGGASVWPEQVEDLLRSHPNVREAVVTSRPNPMIGNILVATVTAHSAPDNKAFSKELRGWVKKKAPSTHVPAMIKVVEEIEVSQAGKVSRD